MKDHKTFTSVNDGILASVKVLCCAIGIALSLWTGQARAQSKVPQGALIAVPTTKILASGHFTRTITAEEWKTIMPKEVRETVKLYLGGKIDQWYVRTDQTGAVFLMNVTSLSEAQTLLDTLPLGKAKLMTFELIELGPLSPLNSLLKNAAATDPGLAAPTR
jgi:hypothetical protein